MADKSEDWFDTYMIVDEAEALLEFFHENGCPEALDGFDERIRMELAKLGIDFE